MKKYRILGLLLNNELRTGGHRRYLELLSGLAAKGHSVHVVVNQDMQLPFTVECTLLPISVKSGRKRAVAFQKSVRQNVGNITERVPAIDLVVVFGETHYFAGLFLKKYYHAKLLFSFRSNVIQEDLYKLKSENMNIGGRLKLCVEMGKYWWYERLIAKNADMIVFQSRYDQGSFLSRNGSVAEKCRIIGGNICTPWFAAEFSGANKSRSLRNILYIGSINTRKGIRFLLDAFELLCADNNDLMLTIIGFGPDEEKLRDRVLHSTARKQINVVGRCRDPFPYLQDTDVLVVPSLFDSYPNVVLEAIFTETALLASRTGGIPEMLEYDELLFEPGSAVAIQTQIEGLYDEKAFSHNKALVKKLRAKFEFDWVAEFEKLIYAIL
jgi:glycosyltransferase involved in cell wall biosynthesis